MRKSVQIIPILLLLLFAEINSQWVLTSSGNGFDIFSMHFPSVNTGYVCGYGNFLNKTTNSGLNWLNITPFVGTAQNLNAIFFISENTGWLSSTDNNVYYTTNGGTNWTVNFTPIYGYQIQFINTLTGWVGGSNKIIRTTNGGVNWTAINVNTTGTIYFADAMTGWTVTYSAPASTIHKSTDGGFSWVPQYTTTDFANIYAFKFINNNTGWASGYREIILKTTNGGTNWVQQRNIAGSTGLYSIDFINESTGWIAGDYNTSGSRILSTTTGGTIWNESFIGNGRLFKVQLINSTIGFMAGQYNKVYKTTNLGGITSVRPVSNNTPNEFSLEQNFPNPFNPSTKIKFAIPPLSSPLLKTESSTSEGGDRSVVLIIYNILGKEIASLVNQQLKPGTYEVEWDASDYPSGIYFYSLKTQSFNQTKKMILMK